MPFVYAVRSAITAITELSLLFLPHDGTLAILMMEETVRQTDTQRDRQTDGDDAQVG